MPPWVRVRLRGDPEERQSVCQGRRLGSFRSGCSMRRTTSVAPRRTPPQAPPSLWVHSKWSRAGKAGALGSSPHSRGGPKYKVINMKGPEEAVGSPYFFCKPYGQLPVWAATVQGSRGRTRVGERMWGIKLGGRLNFPGSRSRRRRDLAPRRQRLGLRGGPSI